MRNTVPLALILFGACSAASETEVCPCQAPPISFQTYGGGQFSDFDDDGIQVVRATSDSQRSSSTPTMTVSQTSAYPRVLLRPAWK